MELDSVTLEVLSRKLAAITDEMYFSVQRASRSSYVKEAADFAVALLDVNGEVFAYPPSATFAFSSTPNSNRRSMRCRIWHRAT
jgi:N-methylhydantoinase B